MHGPSSGCSPGFYKQGLAGRSRSLTLRLHGESSRGRPSHARQKAGASPCLLESQGAGAGHEIRHRGGTRLSASSGRKGMQTGLCRVCACARARARVRVCTMSLHCVLTPHLRQEGPLSETIDLPTCHAFAKTKISKDTSSFSGGARARGSPPGGTDPLSFSVARS